MATGADVDMDQVTFSVGLKKFLNLSLTKLKRRAIYRPSFLLFHIL